MSYCTNCHQQNHTGTAFCRYCGTSLSTGPRNSPQFGPAPAYHTPHPPYSAQQFPQQLAATMEMEPAGTRPLSIGTIVDGKYTIESKIAEGGMGVVYFARDVYLDTPVVIKGIRPELAQDTQFRARILAEGKAMAKIDHENVVRLNSVVVQADELFLVMQYVDGESLETTIARCVAQRVFMPIAEVFRIFHQILAGIGAAHAEGMIHRDIKPANILIRRKDAQVRVTVLALQRPRTKLLRARA